MAAEVEDIADALDPVDRLVIEEVIIPEQYQEEEEVVTVEDLAQDTLGVVILDTTMEAAITNTLAEAADSSTR